MLKIAPGHQRLLAEIDLRGDVTREELARAVRMKSSNAHYAISSLIERGALIRRARIDFFRLGLMDVAVFFSVTESAKGARKQLEKALLDDERTGWVSRLVGEYQYAVILLVRTLSDVAEFVGWLKSFRGISVGDLILAPRTSFSQLSRRYLGAHTSGRRRLDFEALHSAIHPDELDHRILSRLGRPPFESLRATARELGLPFSTVESRVKRLRESGVIRGFYYEVVPAALGLLAFRFLISTTATPLDLSSRFEKFCFGHPTAVFLINALGSWDYEVGIEAEDASSALEFAGEMSDLLGPHLRSIRTIQEVEDLKWTFYPFRRNPFVDRPGQERLR